MKSYFNFFSCIFFSFVFFTAQLEKLSATMEDMALDVKGVTAQQVSFE